MHPLRGRIPLIRPANGTQAAALGRDCKRVAGERGICERAKGDEPVGAGEAPEQEAINAVCHRPCEDLGEWAGIASVRPPQRIQVPRTVSLVDDRRGISMSNEQEIRRQSTGSPVSVAEGMDPFEASVDVGDERHRMLAFDRRSARVADPIGYERRHLRKRRRCHPAGEGTDVVRAKRTWPLTGVEAVRRRVQPNRLDDELVDLAKFGQASSCRVN